MQEENKNNSDEIENQEPSEDQENNDIPVEDEISGSPEESQATNSAEDPISEDDEDTLNIEQIQEIPDDYESPEAGGFSDKGKKGKRKKKEKKKSFIGRLLKFFLFVLIIPIILIAVLFVKYLVTRVDPADYLSSDFILYTEIESLGDIYDSMIDLKALEVFLSGQEQKKLFETLTKFKSGSLARQPLFRGILDIEAHIQILEDGKPVIVLDPGIRAVITQLFPLFQSLYQIDDLNIMPKKGYSFFQYVLNAETGSALYILFYKNLIFISTDIDTILSLTENEKNDTTLAGLGKISRVKKQIREKGFLTCYVQIGKLLPYIFGKDSKEWKFIDQQMFFPSLSVVTADLSNEQLSVSFYSDVEYRNLDLLESLRKWEDSKLNAVEYLPEETSVYTAYRFSSFLDIYAIFLSLQEGNFDDILSTAEKAAGLAFNLSLEEVFAWIGSEVGGFYINSSTDPVLFVEVEDQEALDNFFKKLTSSIFIKQEKDVVINDIRIKQIGFPSFIQTIVNHFVKGIREPYYLQIDDYIFFSMDPEAIAAVAAAKAEGRTIGQTETYREITADFPETGSVFLYFDLSESMPGFLASKPELKSFMELYEKGLLTFSIGENDIRLELSAVPVDQRKTRLYPGYPVELEGNIDGDPVFVSKSARGIPKLAYTSDDENLNLVNLTGTDPQKFSIGEKISLLVPENANSPVQTLYFLTTQGVLYRTDMDLKVKAPSPYQGISSQTFLPVFHNGYIYYFVLDSRELRVLDPESAESAVYPFSMLKPLHVPPAFGTSASAIYPKDITGTVYLTDNNGEVLPGWPQRGGGVSSSGPVIHEQDGQLYVIFITQAGILNVWNKDGDYIEGFPLELDGVFYAQPVIFRQNESYYIALINASGEAMVIGLDGKVIVHNKIPGVKGRETQILAYDSNADGESELYFYGSRDFIVRTDGFLRLSPGFPVDGYTRPLFVDYDGDGKKELVSAGLDNKLYIYTLEEPEIPSAEDLR